MAENRVGDRRSDDDGVVRLVALTEHDEPALQALIESDPGYAQRITGYPPGPSDALSLLISRPPDLSVDDKLVRGIMAPTATGEELVGVVDALVGWPDPATAHLGLLLVRPAWRRRGIGRHALSLLTYELCIRPTITGLRVALVQANDVGESNEFWASCGFVATGEHLPHRYDHVESTTDIHRRQLR